jgi:hypothetical protein
MNTSFPPSAASAADWQAWFDYAADQQRFPRDQRRPCGNPDCDALCASVYCRESCREAVEGPEPDGEPRPAPPIFPLGEAPVSMNVQVQMAGRSVQITLRGTRETEVLARMEALLAKYPVAQAQEPASPSTPQCPLHHVPMRLNEKHGEQWYSHRIENGKYCKGR